MSGLGEAGISTESLFLCILFFCLFVFRGADRYITELVFNQSKFLVLVMSLSGNVIFFMFQLL